MTTCLLDLPKKKRHSWGSSRDRPDIRRGQYNTMFFFGDMIETCVDYFESLLACR